MTTPLDPDRLKRLAQDFGDEDPQVQRALERHDRRRGDVVRRSELESTRTPAHPPN